jgi:signal transduction histidine kinase
MSIQILDKSTERKKRVLASAGQSQKRSSPKSSGSTQTSDEISELKKEIRRLESIAGKKDEKIAELNELNLHFLNSAAHDLRNPLGVIQMYCDFMRSEPDENYDESVREFISIISSTGTQMQRIINNILDYSKLGSGRISMEMMPVEVDQLLHRSVLTNTEKAQAHNITLSLKPEESGTVLNIDSQWIEQAISSLIDNAIKFSQPGTTVTLSSRISDQGIYISVKDEGQGIPESEHQKLFKPFGKTCVQPLNGDSRNGLGLAIVKTIVEKHNGAAGFDSSPGAGSEFYLWLPI